MEATPTQNKMQLRQADFSSLADALDYAAQGETGFNFYRGGKLRAVLPYATLRKKARILARRLCGLGVERGGRVGLVADTDPGFIKVPYHQGNRLHHVGGDQLQLMMVCF